MVYGLKCLYNIPTYRIVLYLPTIIYVQLIIIYDVRTTLNYDHSNIFILPQLKRLHQ